LRSQRPRPVNYVSGGAESRSERQQKHSEKRVTISVRVEFRLASRGLEREGARKLLG